MGLGQTSSFSWGGIPRWSGDTSSRRIHKRVGVFPDLAQGEPGRYNSRSIFEVTSCTLPGYLDLTYEPKIVWNSSFAIIFSRS